jgi:hypothetical protein
MWIHRVVYSAGYDRVRTASNTSSRHLGEQAAALLVGQTDNVSNAQLCTSAAMLESFIDLR